ncbi:male sterility protein-domain-containing protein [Armillaria luteobubalina]|uniref:Male sterility protein-domain-containing protein n=1 Tax=Armillaria luteobubalina TaxID=153913 RepID=A0AA39QAT1_9AGAR|nr:male sterility protein-domain-containing protein [Armillaria luteobubalina]
MGESWAAGGLDWRLKFGQLRLREKRKKVAAEVDAILYSGALVHGVYPYKKLRAANIISILTAIELASTGKPTFVVFVSSTSAIDTEHYVRLSESLIDSNHQGVPASDVSGGARASLKTRGLKGHIVCPGYVVGDSQSTVTDANDVIWRMGKGYIQLGLVPDMNSTVDMVLIDHVASCTMVEVLATSYFASIEVEITTQLSRSGNAIPKKICSR